MALRLTHNPRPASLGSGWPWCGCQQMTRAAITLVAVAGSVSVPGLSSFSFIHGALVGGAVILLLAADKLTPQQPQQTADQQVRLATPQQSPRSPVGVSSCLYHDPCRSQLG